MENGKSKEETSRDLEGSFSRPSFSIFHSQFSISSDDFFRRQRCQFLFAQAQLAAEYLLIVLSQKWRRRWCASRAVDQKAVARLLKGAQDRMRHRAKKAARPDMWILHEIRRRVYRQTGDAVFLKQLGQFFLEEARSERSDLRIDVFGVLPAQVAVDRKST